MWHSSGAILHMTIRQPQYGLACYCVITYYEDEFLILHSKRDLISSSRQPFSSTPASSPPVHHREPLVGAKRQNGFRKSMACLWRGGKHRTRAPTLSSMNWPCYKCCSALVCGKWPRLETCGSVHGEVTLTQERLHLGSALRRRGRG